MSDHEPYLPPLPELIAQTKSAIGKVPLGSVVSLQLEAYLKGLTSPVHDELRATLTADLAEARATKDMHKARQQECIEGQLKAESERDALAAELAESQRLLTAANMTAATANERKEEADLARIDSEVRMLAKVDRLMADLAQCRAALMKYGQHLKLCRMNLDCLSCTCGLTEALTSTTPPMKGLL